MATRHNKLIRIKVSAIMSNSAEEGEGMGNDTATAKGFFNNSMPVYFYTGNKPKEQQFPSIEWTRESEPDTTRADNNTTTYTSVHGWTINGKAIFSKPGGVSTGGTYNSSVSTTTEVKDFTLRRDDTSWMFY